MKTKITRGSATRKMGNNEDISYKNRSENLTLYPYILKLATRASNTSKLLINSREHLTNLSNQSGKSVPIEGNVKRSDSILNKYLEWGAITGTSTPYVASNTSIKTLKTMLSISKSETMPEPEAFLIYIPGKGKYWGIEHLELMSLLRILKASNTIKNYYTRNIPEIIPPVSTQLAERANLENKISPVRAVF